MQEVLLAKEILKACGIRRYGIDFVSCPTCGRTEVDLESIARRVKERLLPVSERLEKEKKFMRVSVMGCVVNGPGEARGSDYGIACGKGEGAVFRRGQVIKKLPEEALVEGLAEAVERDLK